MEKNLITLIESCSSFENSNLSEFLTEEEVLKVLNKSTPSTSSTQNTITTRFKFHQPVAVVWDVAETKLWYIGFVVSESSDSILIDHLERKVKGSDNVWQRPHIDDIQSTHPIQIVPCPVSGEWNLQSRVPQFDLQNGSEITEKFHEHWKL